MRTTLAIDDDILQAAHERGRVERRTVGSVISDWARCGYAHRGVVPSRQDNTDADDQTLQRLGVHVLPSRGGVVTNDEINRIREEIGV
ncbi:MAG: hypothetical protein FWD59_00945 [Micrococcales bacterium]|nr:hypothetical protein [Micrococcales bacterium]